MIKLSVNETNGVVCWPAPEPLFLIFRFEYLISGPKSYWDFRETGPRIAGLRVSDALTSGSRCLLDCKTVRIFAYSSTREQSNEAENRPYGRVRLARKTLTPRFTDFFTDVEKKTDCFAV